MGKGYLLAWGKQRGELELYRGSTDSLTEFRTVAVGTTKYILSCTDMDWAFFCADAAGIIMVLLRFSVHRQIFPAQGTARRR